MAAGCCCATGELDQPATYDWKQRLLANMTHFKLIEVVLAGNCWGLMFPWFDQTEWEYAFGPLPLRRVYGWIGKVPDSPSFVLF